MSWVSIAVAGASIVGGVVSSRQQARAGQRAAGAQSDAALAGIDEQRRQFDEIRALLSPYVNAGNMAMIGQLDLLGLNGDDPQQAAIDAIRASPAFTEALKAGETSLLSNASATGGLRSGNTQGALAQFSPRLLAQSIDDRYRQLGGLASLGQGAATMTGNAGMVTGRGVSDLLQQQGAAQAGGILARGRGQAGTINSIFQGFGTFAGLGGLNGGYRAPSVGSGVF